MFVGVDGIHPPYGEEVREAVSLQRGTKLVAATKFETNQLRHVRYTSYRIA